MKKFIKFQNKNEIPLLRANHSLRPKSPYRSDAPVQNQYLSRLKSDFPLFK